MKRRCLSAVVGLGLVLLSASACSKSEPGKTLTYRGAVFSRATDVSTSAAHIYAYTPGGAAPELASEQLNVVRQERGVSTVVQTIPLVTNAVTAQGYTVSPVAGRWDALCGVKHLPSGTERTVFLIVPRGERTVQLLHTRRASPEEADNDCQRAAEIVTALDATAVSVP